MMEDTCVFNTMSGNPFKQSYHSGSMYIDLAGFLTAAPSPRPSRGSSLTRHLVLLAKTIA
eukprot:12429562-Karenia_brevis.AAC.1